MGVCGCMCVAAVCGFSNNYEFSEYLLETNVFMQWPLVQILFVFFALKPYNASDQCLSVSYLTSVEMVYF